MPGKTGGRVVKVVLYQAGCVVCNIKKSICVTDTLLCICDKRLTKQCGNEYQVFYRNGTWHCRDATELRAGNNMTITVAS